MTMILIRKYSTLKEVLKYLSYKTGQEFTIDDIKQLELEGRLHPYIFYDGNVKVHSYKTEGSSILNSEPTPSITNVYFKAIYKPHSLNKMFLSNENSLLFNSKVDWQNNIFQVHEFLEDPYWAHPPYNNLNINEQSSITLHSNTLEVAGLDSADDLLRFNTQEVKSLVESDLNNLEYELVRLQQENDNLKAKIKVLNQQISSNKTQHLLPDKELSYKSQEAVARMLYGILKENDYDLSAHKGKTNSVIVKSSEASYKPVTEKFVSDWLKLVQEVELKSQLKK